MSYHDLAPLDPHRGDLAEDIIEEVEIQIRYDGYLGRQELAARRLRESDSIALPADFAYQELAGLSREAAAKLAAVKPRTLGQAGRIPGVTPAALQVLMVHLHRVSAADRSDSE
jgi:tRNA uridine 5-carboxymethylaminomethyl modification enzyme